MFVAEKKVADFILNNPDSHSGNSKTIIRAFELVKEKGIKSIVISNSCSSLITKLSDYMLLSPGSD